MHKRFTDTEKWQPWFRKLTPEQKVFWMFLCDHCDASGVWERDDEVAKLYCSTQLDIDVAIERFNADKQRIQFLNNGSKLFLVDFISFQYSRLKRFDLNGKENRVHSPIFKLLVQHGIDYKKYEDDCSRGSTEALQSLLDTDTEKDKEKDLENDKGKERGIVKGDQVKDLLAHELFGRLTQTQREGLCAEYPEEFLVNTLSSYIASSERNHIPVMHPRTVFNWLERDFRQGRKPQNAKEIKQTMRREKLMREMEGINLEN